MTDTDNTALIERLRSRDNPDYWTREVREEAADALEALQARAEKAEAALAELDAAS